MSSDDLEQDLGEDQGINWGLIGILVLLGSVGIFFLALPTHVTPVKHNNETAAIGALKTIGLSQSLFREADKERDGNLDYGTLAELAGGEAPLIDSVLGSGTKNGYVFEVTYGAATSEFLWYATARPLGPRAGDRYFCANHEGVVFYTTRAPFPMNSADCTVPAGVSPVGK